MKLLILNGSIAGKSGNTAKLIGQLCKFLPSDCAIDVRHLASDKIPTRDEFVWADAFLFTSGVYWDSWGSPLQKFFEDLTFLEGDSCLFGKPAAALVTMHSVGGKEVLSRLQGVLNTFGLFVPPMSAMTYSFANQVALESSPRSSLSNDLWCPDDLAVLAKNLQAAVQIFSKAKMAWSSWPVDRDDPKRIWVRDVSV